MEDTCPPQIFRGGHMSSTDFCGHTQKICSRHRKSMEDTCPSQKEEDGGRVSSIDFGAIQTKNNGPF